MQRLAAARSTPLAFATVDDYRCAITALAQDAELLTGYRRHLEDQRMALPLFDTPRYTREFEDLLERMVQRWRSEVAVDHLLASG